MKKISDCTHLKCKNTVVLNDLLSQTICLLDDECAKAELYAMVTSGIRTPQKQLSIIVEACLKRGIDKEFPEIKVATVDNEDSWLMPWGRLLTMDYMVNPPIPAKAPFDYTRSDGTPRKAGHLVGYSGHQLAHSFDVAEAPLDKIEEVVKGSMKVIPMIKDCLVEPKNGSGAVHIDCQEPKMKGF